MRERTALQCHSACNFDPRIASSKMLPDNFLVVTVAVPPNQFGGPHGEEDQHGGAARGFIGGGGALPIGRAGREGAHPRRALPNNGLASQARGSGIAATCRR